VAAERREEFWTPEDLVDEWWLDDYPATPHPQRRGRPGMRQFERGVPAIPEETAVRLEGALGRAGWPDGDGAAAQINREAARLADELARGG
jgi:hypothetical protein